MLAKAIFPTEPGSSVIRNRVQPYWGSAHLVVQKLWELHQYGPEHLQRRILPAIPYRGKRKLYTMPTTGEIAGWLGPLLARKAWRRVRRAVGQQKVEWHWRMAIRVGTGGILAGDAAARMAGFRWVDSPKGHSYADPFAVKRDGKHWIFFEDFDYASNCGVIACAEVSSEGALGPAQLALDTESHASYPAVFAHDGETFMIPETLVTGEIRLYRATRFPYKWTIEKVLYRAPAVDTSMVFTGGRWWFFTTLVESRGGAQALYLFSSETLTGEWQYHPSNPVCFDTRRARCGGHILEEQGRLYRLSQDCSGTYGRSFTLNEITTLTPGDYEEQAALTVEPWEPGLVATHTYNRAGVIEVTDGRRNHPRALVL